MNKSISAFIWKLLERFGYLGAQFILQIILARILSPQNYGTLSLMMIFTTIANVFIQTGFNTALIQNKDVTDEDYSSVFWVSLVVASVIYAIMFFSAPAIAVFYNMPDIVQPLRVLSLILFPGAINSIQLAKVSKELDFKKVFVSNIGSVIISGVVGIAVAVLGGGLWALVIQSLLQITIACFIMFFSVKWFPRFVFNVNRIRILLKFGWKMLVSQLIDTIYIDIYSLVMGKKYNEATLGFYNRGKQFPQFIISGINGAVQSVILPTMSSKQDDKGQIKSMMRTSVMLSSYIVFPMMAGLAAVASPLISILLTDKWLPCVPYLQICCFTMAFYPVHSCNLQAINAMGRSDVFLKLEIIKKTYGIAFLIFALAVFDSPIAIAAMGIVSTMISSFVNAFPNKKLIGYSYLEQMKDILPAFAISLIMLAVVLTLGYVMPFAPMLEFVIQIVVGVIVYIALSAVLRVEAFALTMNILKGFLRKKQR